MIKVSVLYPNSTDATFDIDYYCNSHIPMVGQLLGSVLKGGAVDSGVSGGFPGVEAPFIAMGHMLFDSVEAFQDSFGPQAETIMGDLPNFTNTQPLIQISEVKL
ncbi:MAG: EthD family reductase [Motiliproteus sp.]